MIRFSAERSLGQPRRAGVVSPRRADHPLDDRRGPVSCWQILGMARDDPASNEAGDALVEQLPGQGPANQYYWYYGTLAMFQVAGATIGGSRNEALRDAIAGQSADHGPAGRQLGPGRRLGRLRRPDLQHFALRPLLWRFTTGTSPSIRSRGSDRRLVCFVPEGRLIVAQHVSAG